VAGHNAGVLRYRGRNVPVHRKEKREEEAKSLGKPSRQEEEAWAVLVSLMASMWMLQTTFFLAAL